MRAPLLAVAISAGLIIAAACESAPDEVEVLDLGSYDIGVDTGGFSGPVAVELPELTTSTVAYCGGIGDQALGAVWTLTGPDGSVEYSGDDGDASQWRSDFVDDLVPGLLPVSPKLPASEGTWSFDWFFGPDNGGSVNCKAVVRSGSGDDIGSDASIDVEVVFVGVDLDAAGAADDPDWQAVMDAFESEWETAGLTVSPTYKDFGGNLDRFTVVDVTNDDYSEFNDLLRSSSPDDTRSMTFFVVEEIVNNSEGGATILGLSGGPPGVATVHGTSKSGVIVSGIDLRDAPEDVGKIMAHEGGHFLGLFHTTEKDLSNTDPLDDTPECSNDADSDGEISPSECEGADVGNVMFYALTSGTSSFTADQGWVLRRNPVAY